LPLSVEACTPVSETGSAGALPAAAANFELENAKVRNENHAWSILNQSFNHFLPGLGEQFRWAVASSPIHLYEADQRIRKRVAAIA